LERLAQTLELARKTAFYRPIDPILTEMAEFLKIAALSPLPAPALEEKLAQVLAGLPLTEPASVAENPDLFLAVSQSDVAGVVTVPTSGSTGQAKRIYSTEADLKNTEDFYYFGMREMVSPADRDRVALLMSGLRPGSVGDMLTRALGRWPIECQVPGFVPLGRPEFLDWFMELILWRPTCLVAVPAQALALANHELGPKLGRTVRSTLLSGDVAPQSLIQTIERRLPYAKVFLHYGQTEFGLGGAVECRHHLGPHFREADIALEILGPEGQNLSPGEVGEMVLTSLSREAMPLIRYRTGDMGSVALGVCPCGSVFRRIKTFGRAADRVVWPDGRSLDLWKIGEILYGLPGLSRYKAIGPQAPDYRLKLEATTRLGPSALAEKALRDLLADLPWEITYSTSLDEAGPTTGKQTLIKPE
jgi:phenylacetate-coenzyme A ligase PaaK-like adenylate-forming protein